MKLSLYSIEQEYIQLAEQLTENGGELTPELELALTINQQDLQTKSTNYGLVIKQLEYNNDIVDQEIDRLKALKQARVNAVDRLKQNISEAMKIYGIEKIETPILKISFRKSESVEIDNDRLIPGEYWVEKTTATISKTAIKTAIQEGKDVPGASMKTNQNIQIK
jgi:hypothetical protein